MKKNPRNNDLAISILIVFYTLQFFLVNSAIAVDKKNSKTPKKVNINFEGENISGTFRDAEIALMLKKKQGDFEKLIELRNSFMPELRESTARFK